MTNALASLLKALVNSLNSATDNDSNDRAAVGHLVTINIGNGSASNLGVRFVIDQNTSLTDPAIFGPILSALITRVIDLRSGENQDASLEVEILSEGNGNQLARRTSFTIQRSTVPQVPNPETDLEIPITSEDAPVDSAVRGILTRLLRSLSNRVE